MLFAERLKLLQQHLKNELNICPQSKQSQFNKLSNAHIQTKLLNTLAEQTRDMEFASHEDHPDRARLTYLGKTHTFRTLVDAEKRAVLYDRYRDVCQFIRETNYDDGEKPALNSAIAVFMQNVKANPQFADKLGAFSYNENWLNIQRNL